MRQALRADPNTLEMLFADAKVVDPIGAHFVEMRDGFLSQEIYGSFGRYALSQLDRLEHNQRLADHRAVVIDWLRENPTLGIDEPPSVSPMSRTSRRRRGAMRCCAPAIISSSSIARCTTRA